MLDLLNETIERRAIFFQEAHVLDLTLPRWVCAALVDKWRGEVLAELRVLKFRPNRTNSISGNYQHAVFITVLSGSYRMF